MPSEFETEFAESAAPDLMDTFGRAAVYTSPEPGSAGISGVVRIQNETPVDGNADSKTNKKVFVRQAVVKCLATFVEVPRIDGRFLVEGKDRWTVVSRPVLRNGMWEMNAQCIQEHRLNEPQAARN